jgi:hypothetical protein
MRGVVGRKGVRREGGSGGLTECCAYTSLSQCFPAYPLAQLQRCANPTLVQLQRGQCFRLHSASALQLPPPPVLFTWTWWSSFSTRGDGFAQWCMPEAQVHAGLSTQKVVVFRDGQSSVSVRGKSAAPIQQGIGAGVGGGVGELVGSAVGCAWL